MTLSVHAYTRKEDGGMEFIEPAESFQDMAGFESFRTEFYGSKAARVLGLTLLPALANADLYLSPEELPTLEAETQLILQNVDQFTEEAGKDSERLSFYLHNILNAISLAKQANGHVVIW